MDLDFWDCFGRKNLRLTTEEIRYSDIRSNYNIETAYAKADLGSNGIRCMGILLGEATLLFSFHASLLNGVNSLRKDFAA